MRKKKGSKKAKPEAVAPPVVEIPKRPTIEELEKILNSEEERIIEILPNGEVRAVEGKPQGKKPITFRENLGGEYAA